MANNHLPPVLDACCGGRMMWFNAEDPRGVFVDCRCETLVTDTRPGRRPYVVRPDVLADFASLPFPDDTFALVVFDPPHIVRDAPLGWITQKYGVLSGDWRQMLRRGFSECFRVLKPQGTLIFKWSEGNVALSEVLKLTEERPLFGHRTGRNTHWLAFLKPPIAP